MTHLPGSLPMARRTWLFAALLIAGCLLPSLSALQAQEKTAPKTVTLTVDYGDGVKKVFSEIPWKEKLTVFAALEEAVKHPRGVKVKTTGRGSTTMVIAIDELTNTGSERNWLFRVNGDLGDRSSALVELAPGDAVLWQFAEYE